jgi:hypothetical protein
MPGEPLQPPPNIVEEEAQNEQGPEVHHEEAIGMNITDQANFPYWTDQGASAYNYGYEHGGGSSSHYGGYGYVDSSAPYGGYDQSASHVGELSDAPSIVDPGDMT